MDVQAILYEACSNTFTYVLDWAVNDPESKDHSLKGAAGAFLWGLISGYLGGFISQYYKVNGIAEKLMRQTKNGHSALAFLLSNVKILSSVIITAITLLIGMSLKASSDSDEVMHEDVGIAMETTGDVLSDSAYVILSEALDLPPNSLSLAVDLTIILVKLWTGELIENYE